MLHSLIDLSGERGNLPLTKTTLLSNHKGKFMGQSISFNLNGRAGRIVWLLLVGALLLPYPIALQASLVPKPSFQIAPLFFGIETVVETNFINLSCERKMITMSQRHVWDGEGSLDPGSRSSGQDKLATGAGLLFFPFYRQPNTCRHSSSPDLSRKLSRLFMIVSMEPKLLRPTPKSSSSIYIVTLFPPTLLIMSFTIRF